MADTSLRQRLSIFVCLGLMLIYPLFAVSVQKATASLAGSVGEIEARTITEGAIWLFGALVLGIALSFERRTFASIGLGRPTLGVVPWALGSAIVFLAMGALVSFLTYNVLHQANRAVAEVESLVRGSLVYALCIALRGGVIEEVLYRGLAIEQLTVLTRRRWLAASLATVFFILVHTLRFDLRQLVSISVLSVGFALLYLWRRNLWINIVAHFLIDALALGAVALRATSLY